MAKEAKTLNYQARFSVILGLLQLRTENTGGALEAFGEYKKLNPTYWKTDGTYWASHLGGLTHLSFDSVEKAQEESEKLLGIVEKDNNPNLIRHYHQLLGMIERKKGNLDAAFEHLKKAAALFSFETPFDEFEGLPIFLESLAEVYHESGDLDNARRVYEQISRLTITRIYLSDIYVRAFYNLGKIFEEQRKRKEAFVHFEKFLELWKNADPGLAEVEDAKKRLAKLRAN